MIKHDRHLRTGGKCRKHEPQVSVSYSSWGNVGKIVKHTSMFYTCTQIKCGFSTNQSVCRVLSMLWNQINYSWWAYDKNMLASLNNCAAFKVDGTSFQVFWICKLWKERKKSQLNVIRKFVYDSIAKLVLVQKRQLFCHQLLPWQQHLMIVQTYFWASKAHILKTNLVTPNFFHISFFVIWKWNYMII